MTDSLIFHFVVCVDVNDKTAYIDLDETVNRFENGSVYDNETGKFINPDLDDVVLNELDDLSYQILKELLTPQEEYVLFNPNESKYFMGEDSPYGFWSNELGYTTIEQATVFKKKEIGKYIPLGCIPIKLPSR